MKKYIITIISVLLCCTPVHAQVEDYYCTDYDIQNEGNCNATNGCGWQNGKCDLCPAGTYNYGNGVYGCRNCYKPDQALFHPDTQFAGMEDPYECPWYITCPENLHIDTDKWKDGKTDPSNIKCEDCPRGYHKYAQTRQSWNVNGDMEFITELPNGVNSDGTSKYIEDPDNTMGCSKKEFNIDISVQYVENCTTKNLELTGETRFKIPFSVQIIYSDFIANNPPKTGYKYPSSIGTTFTLTPKSTTPQPENATTPYMTLTASGTKALLKASDDIRDWEHTAGFDLVITLEPKDKIDLYYCIRYPNSTYPTDKVCTKFIYDPCNPNNAKDPSDITEFGIYEFDSYNVECPGGYYDGWNYHINSPSAGTAQKINFGDPIPTLPDGTTAIYMILNTGVCQPGTYYNGICTTKCNICPVGTSSGTGATECTPCTAGTYNDIPGDTCKTCADGYFSDVGATECTQCPAGFMADTGAKSWNDCYMNPDLLFMDDENSAKKLLLTAPNKVYYQGNS